MPATTPKTVTYEVWYTRAPKSYDGFGTVTLTEPADSGMYDFQGNELRRVGLEAANSKWQRDRYFSGMYPAYTDADLTH